MIGATTTVELSPTGIDGDGFDVFSSLRDGADGEKFASGIGEVVADGAGQLDLVAVAGGEAELDVAISDNDTKEDCTLINPEFCRNFGSAACFGCVNLGLCQDRQAAMMANKDNPQSEEQLSTLEQLLREDEAPGEIVWAQVAPETDEAGDLSQIEEVSEVASPGVVEVVLDCEDISEEYSYPKEQKSNIHDEEDVKIADVDVETVKNMEIDNRMVESQATDPGLDEPAEISKQSTPEYEVVLPTSIRIEADPVVPIVEDVKKVNDDFADTVASDIQASPQIEVKEPKLVKVVDIADSLSPVSTVEVPSRETPSHNTTANDTGDYNNSHDMVSEVEEKSALSAIEQELSAQASELSADIQTKDVKRETPAKEIIAAASMPVKKQSDQPAAVPSPIQNSVEHSEEALSVGEESAVDDTLTKPAIVDAPAVYEAVKVVPGDDAVTEREVIDVKPSVATAGNEDELQIELLQDGNQEAAVDQTVYEAQTSPVEQFDDAVIEERSCGDDEVWAEEDVVFFVEQSSAVEPEISLAEAVTAESPAEATIVTSEEIDDPEAFVAHEVEIESIEPLDNLQVVSVPEITKDDYEPVERLTVPTPPTIKLVPIIKSKEAPVQALEKYGLPREKPADVITTTSGENNLWYDDEIKTAVIEIGDVRSDIELPPERLKKPVSDEEMTESAELELYELDEPDELATDTASDEYNYSSEINLADEDFLIIKNHPPFSLWMDDSRLNPEDNRTPATGSTSVISWLTKLVGVVAVYVVYNRRDNRVIYN
jgi:hypothetical protein